MKFNSFFTTEFIQSGNVYTKRPLRYTRTFLNRFYPNLWLLESGYSLKNPQNKVLCLNQSPHWDSPHTAKYYGEIPDEDIYEIFIG